MCILLNHGIQKTTKRGILVVGEVSGDVAKGWGVNYLKKDLVKGCERHIFIYTIFRKDFLNYVLKESKSSSCI